MARQESFIAAILGNPGLATLVQSLTWTLLRPHNRQRGPLLLGNSSRHAISERPILRIWDVFQSLTSVRTLDLAWLSRDHGDPLADGYPNGLFPAATSIRLSGVMHYSFATSILYNNPKKLRHLTLDNLQQIGNSCDHFHYRRANQRQGFLQNHPTLNYQNRPNNPHAPLGRAGPMLNLLRPLAGRCQNLKSLTLRKVGQTYRWEFTRAFAAIDMDIYHEFAFFVDSVKPTLQHLVFEQGHRALLAPQHFRPPSSYRPMDQRFWQILYPHLFFGDWRDLESMEIVGAHITWDDHEYRRNILTSGKGLIRAVTRMDVHVMDHIGLGDPLSQWRR